MVLLGKIVDTETTCLLYKIKPTEGDTNIDTLNVFVALPLHLLRENDFKIIIQVAGNQYIELATPVYVTANMFTVQHTFLDLAIGVLQDPQVINDTPELLEASYFTYDNAVNEGGLINKSVDILYCNQSGIVNNIPTKISNMNYELGSNERSTLYHRLPWPGGFIILEEDAKSGISGSVVVYNDSIVGMIVLSSNTSKGNSNTLARSKALATDTYYFLPHILQCANAIHKFTSNDPIKLAELSNLTVMRTLENDVLPIVNHLGTTFRFIQGSSNTNRSRYLSLANIHNFLDFPFILSEVDSGLSIPVKTTLNTNDEFINYFYSNQQNSEVIVIEASYKDKVSKEIVNIVFESSFNANILDWSFKGDPKAPLELTFQTKTTNNDGSVSLSYPPIKFTFLSSETTDVIFNKTYPRTTMQIPSIAFSRGVALKIIEKNFEMDVELNFLCKCNKQT